MFPNQSKKKRSKLLLRFLFVLVCNVQKNILVGIKKTIRKIRKNEKFKYLKIGLRHVSTNRQDSSIDHAY